MPSILLTKGFRAFRNQSVAVRFYHVGKAASVNTAILRGIRKSKGLGFRGKEKSNDPRQQYLEKNELPTWASELTASPSPSQRKPMTRDGWEGRQDKPEARILRGKKEIKAPWGPRPSRDDRKHTLDAKPSRDSTDSRPRLGRFGEVLRDRSARDRVPAGRDRPSLSRGADGERYSSESGRKLSFEPKPRSSQPSDWTPPRTARQRDEDALESSRDYYSKGSGNAKPHHRFDKSADRYQSSESLGSRFDTSRQESRSGGRYQSSESRESRFDSGRQEPRPAGRYQSSENRVSHLDSGRQEARSGGRYSERDTPEKSDQRYPERSTNRHSDGGKPQERTAEGLLPTTQTINNRIPLSIPYTTPASEFLYGTSVVEAALNSRRTPRRKLYKLYIYTGENREKVKEDADIEKLARKNGVPVAKVGGDWVRLLDKMSTGRPHNGYILEASPIPRLPITSLGSVSARGDHNGFEVVLDHQSREEAAINGTDTFVSLPPTRTGRKPLVLYLDSILDPGNLGGIIRTASFLGVSAVAISTRNSAPFSPVVLKASAGASENITIFSVNKPSGFMVDSKAAGWKVYAAVAPTKKGDPGMPLSLSTDQLQDPLSEDPCILMIGGEGEGLRWNLRSKADADLYIRGSGRSHNVDSLNVSVATGVLCDAFLRRNITPRKAALSPAREAEQAELEEVAEYLKAEKEGRDEARRAGDVF